MDQQALLLQSEYSDPSVFNVFPEENPGDYEEDAHRCDKLLFEGLVNVPEFSEPEFLKAENKKQSGVDLTFSARDESDYASTSSSSLLTTASWNPMPLTDNNHISHVLLPYCCCGGNHWHGNNNNNHGSRSSYPLPCPSYGDSMPYPCSCKTKCHALSKNSDLLNQRITEPIQDNRIASNAAKRSQSKKENHETEIDPQTPPSPVAPVTQMRCQTIPGYQKSRRTKTSYDPKTSYRLNTLFFESFGIGRKPTKEERRRIQKKTGISSRRLTYWLSNHKRRFGPEVSAYKRLSEQGEVDSYDAFVEYCNKHYVPEIQARNNSDTSEDEGTVDSK